MWVPEWFRTGGEIWLYWAPILRQHRQSCSSLEPELKLYYQYLSQPRSVLPQAGALPIELYQLPFPLLNPLPEIQKEPNSQPQLLNTQNIPSRIRSDKIRVSVDLVFWHPDSFNNLAGGESCLIALVSRGRLELPTPWLKVRCSTNWANGP